MTKQGKLVIVSAPSGAGKTTIVRHLLSLGLPLSFSVSATSRLPRQGEIHGQDYFFLTPGEFRRKIEEQAFIEWEEVYPEMYYGTLKSELHRIWDEGKSVIFDVDVAGGLNIKNQFGSNALAIFVMPPSVDALQERLTNRSTESDEKIAMRVAKARHEISFASRFDKVIVNDVLDQALAEAGKEVSHFLAT